MTDFNKDIQLKDGKDLYRACVERLSENRTGEAEGNWAKFPTVIVFLGKISSDHSGIIKSILDDNWRNAADVKYISISGTGSDMKASGLYDFEVFGEPHEIIDTAIGEMLATEESNVFTDKNKIKIDFILDSTEDDAKEYYELFKDFKSQYSGEKLRCLYLMIDQRVQGGRIDKSEKLLDIIKEEEKERNTRIKGGSNTIYLLSNLTRNNDLLGDDSIWKNYRLVSDIIMLSGNDSKSDDIDIQKFYNGFKTASYALLTKPIYDIVYVTLEKLISGIREQEEEIFEGKVSDTTIREKLGIANNEGVKLVHTFFEKAYKENKLPGEMACIHMPFADEKTAKNIFKAKNLTEREFNQLTMGAWLLYVDKVIKERIHNIPIGKETSIAQEVVNLVIKNFSEAEVKKFQHTEDQEHIYELLTREMLDTGVGRDKSGIALLYSRAKFEAEVEMQARLKEYMAEEMKHMINCSKQFEKDYDQISSEIKKITRNSDEDNEFVKQAYDLEVGQYIESKRNTQEKKSAFPFIFNVFNTKEDTLKAIYSEFCKICERELYEQDFDGELDHRMGLMHDTKLEVFIKDKLMLKLNNSIRLKDAYSIAMGNPSCYYLVNKNAKYARSLEGDSGDYSLFYLNRSDCIEELEIYDILSTETLFLKEKESADDN